MPGSPDQAPSQSTGTTLSTGAGVPREDLRSPAAEKELVPTPTGVDARSADGTVSAIALPHLLIDEFEWIVQPAA